jgi:hypothetical protein
VSLALPWLAGVYCSAGFGELYFTAAEACEDLRAHRVLPHYLWTKVVTHEPHSLKVGWMWVA